MFFIIFLSNILINVDHGTLPGCRDQIEKKLNVKDFEYGILGSLVYVGLTLGSAFATGLFSKGEYIKPTLVVTLLLNAVSLFLFTMTSSFIMISPIRLMIGFFQIFTCIFYPVWCDTYGPERYKSAWLTIMLLASPLGIVLGYALTYYMN